MKAVSRSDVHFRIGMMSAMESPEKFQLVICAMPPIHPKVKKKQGEEDARPFREHQPVEHTKVMRGNPSRDPRPERDDREAGDARIEQPQKKIASAMPSTFQPSVSEQRKKRSRSFPGQQQEKQRKRAGGSKQLQMANLLVHSLHFDSLRGKRK